MNQRRQQDKRMKTRRPGAFEDEDEFDDED